MAKRKPKKREAVVRLFAEKLREVRLLRGMTQAELAAAAEVSVTYVSELESADTTPGIDLVARLAGASTRRWGNCSPPRSRRTRSKRSKSAVRVQLENLLATADRTALLTLSPLLALLAEASKKRQ